MQPGFHHGPLRFLLVALVITPAACVRAPRLDVAPRTLACQQVTPDDRQSLAWIAPAAPRDRRKLAEWCATVGPVVFEPTPMPAADSAVDRVAVVSWNTHVGGGDVAGVLDRVRRGEFTSGERFGAVVLLLQEMYRTGGGVPERPLLAVIPRRIADALHAGHGRDVRRVAREEGLALLYAPSMRNGALADDPEDRGNAILSTLPLSAPAVVELPFERQRRAVPIATIAGRTTQGAAWRLSVADVHLDTALGLTRGGPLSARRRQADALVAALTKGLSIDGPTIVAGDFNTWLGDREPAIHALKAAFPDAAPPHSGPTWTGPLGVRATLDYVFARAVRSIQVRRLPDRFGSDHYPLLAIVGF
jgi:endonuclease/exonuclease/phosphatase family metal-dependent hydrolase